MIILSMVFFGFWAATRPLNISAMASMDIIIAALCSLYGINSMATSSGFCTTSNGLKVTDSYYFSEQQFILVLAYKYDELSCSYIYCHDFYQQVINQASIVQ